MSRFERPLTGKERTFAPDDIIVSKTDRFGRITYANRVFCEVAQYREEELIGKPHSIVRHPDMPRCVFQVLWDTIRAGREIFAYVLNRASSGDHYWVFAHVTPTLDASGQITGYHSSRRCPNRRSIAAVKPLYAELVKLERSHSDPRAALTASIEALTGKLKSLGVSYDEFVFSLPTEIESAAGAAA